MVMRLPYVCGAKAVREGQTAGNIMQERRRRGPGQGNCLPEQETCCVKKEGGGEKRPRGHEKRMMRVISGRSDSNTTD